MLDDLFHLSSTSLSLLAAIVCLLVLRLYNNFSSQEKRSEPPGPKPLPLLGNLLQVDLKRLDSSLFNLSKKYGPVFTVYFGLQKVIVLAGYQTVKQALVNHAEEFGDREITPIFRDFTNEHGILFSNGDTWKEMRRFALSTLRDFGMGKRITEEKIIEECRYLIKELEQYEGKAFNNNQVIGYAASNIISALMYGKRFEYKDPVFQAMVERDHETIHLTGSASILIYNMFPWLRPFLKNWRDAMKNVEENKKDVKDIIADLKETLNPDMCRCFIDAFQTRKLNLEESGLKDSHYHDDNLIYSVMNLFAAGTDTTGNTLKWCLLFMAKYPHIQDQVQEELSRVVGSRQVGVEDRKNLPYTDAVIHESQRLANIVPMAIPHKTSRDVTFQGYFIKEGTTVLPLLTSVLYDEGEWESPHTFNPSHFLDKDGKLFRRDAFMPFSAGRRVCLGESLARMELFLFFTSLLQHFRFTPPPGVTEDELDLSPVVGFTLTPSPHELCAVSRHSQDKRRNPPGPKPLPLLGNLLQLDLKRLDNSLFDLSKKYGPVFTVYFGPQKVIVLAGYRTVKQALVNHAEEFGDREITPIFYDFTKGHGIIFSNGDTWKEMRRFALNTLRDFGMGKRLTEGKIIEECRYLIEEFEQYEGKAFDNSQAITCAVSNILSALMYGKRIGYKDPFFQAILEKDHKIIQLTGSASILIYNMFPWLRPFLKNWRVLMKNVEENKKDIKDIIADLKETLNPDMCRCFIDAFLTRKLNLEESGLKDSHYHDDNLIYSVMNLFAAGTDTTGNTLKWCLLFMAKYPHIQDQVQEELSRVVGSRQVGVEDRKNLPYTDAVIHESQRLANIVPMAIPHKTSRDVTFQGYFIKEGTTVLPLLTSVLYDESEWESPHTFNPSHFLDKDGKFIRRDAFMPFSAGRRVCLGESLARMELFLFFTSLLQHFRFTPPPGVTEDELDLTPVVGFTLSTSPHELCAVSRH
ncbi:cytochrome P450 2K1-like [Symphorus nematophorus]